jgi:electron transport complex protein RnfC
VTAPTLVQVDRRLARGLRLKAFKTMSTDKPIDYGFQPKQLIVSLRQHAGTAATALVAPQEYVTAGQTIARAGEDPPSAAIHAPLAGTVIAVEDRLLPDGLGPAVVIDVDPNATDAPVIPPEPINVHELRDAGIVGLGGAVFPTGDKITYAGHCPTLLINGAECEPYISCDDMLMRERAISIARGSLVLLDLCDAAECIIGIESDKPEAFRAMSAALRELADNRLALAEIPTVYPAGGERQLIQVLTGLEVPAGYFPPEIGYLCQNVATAAAIDDLVLTGAPLTHRVVTITGDGVVEPRNIWAPVGTPIAELIAYCGGYQADASRLIMGGSMMGFALPDDAIPITKATNCIISASQDTLREQTEERPCIRCGDCASVCPATLMPQELYRHASNHQWDHLSELHLNECIECGCCDVVCPSHILLTEHFRTAKHNLAQHQQELQRAERAATRFEEHEHRLDARTREEQGQLDKLRATARDPEGRVSALEAAKQRAAAKRSERPD